MSNFESKSKELIAKLKQAESRALEGIGVFVTGEATVRSPVDTGNLRGSISHKAGDKSVSIGTNVDYAIFIEKGTRKMKAQPFLEPAVDENIGRIGILAKELMKL